MTVVPNKRQNTSLEDAVPSTACLSVGTMNGLIELDVKTRRTVRVCVMADVDLTVTVPFVPTSFPSTT